ncbi:MAG: hypothetical protein ACJA2W_001307, partial [Planctomycetota bacterium]
MSTSDSHEAEAPKSLSPKDLAARLERGDELV